MHFFTPRKAAAGLGASGGGTADHWAMTISAVGLAILTQAGSPEFTGGWSDPNSGSLPISSDTRVGLLRRSA